MQRAIFNTIFTAILVTFITGCGTTEAIKPVSGPDAAAAYGHITIPVGLITNVMLYKVGEVYKPPLNSPPQSHAFPNGDYLFDNLEPGKYFLLGFKSGEEAFYFNQGNDDPKLIKEFNIDVKPGSAAYLGSFEVTGIDQNFVRSESFEILRSKTPTRSAILKHLIEVTKGTGWDEVFEKALK